MTKKSPIYTKSGDKGETSLVSGTRVSKADQRIDMYGEVDELNSFIGYATAHLDDQKFSKLIEINQKIQSALFDMGANLACEKDKRGTYKLPTLEASLLQKVEEMIDECDETLPKLTTFILPGGDVSSSAFHLCRTICRRVERSLILFESSHPGEIPLDYLKFLNRLSDYFFIVARFVLSQNGKKEIFWIPNR